MIAQLRRSAAAICLSLLLAPAWSRAAEATGTPLFSFGAVADVQYGDKENSGPRHYRLSRDLLTACVAEFNRQKPDFVIQLGDLIDGYKDAPAKSRADQEAMLAILAALKPPLYHAAGNHDMNAGAERLRSVYALDSLHYEFTRPEARGWRFVVLDGNDAGYGVVGAAQLAWFREVLARAKAANERVICFCHFPLSREASPHHRMANPEPLLKTIEEAGCVAAWIAGHDHFGGYALRNGVHHLTLQGMVECPPDRNAFAVVRVYPDRLAVTGFGSVPSRDLSLKPAAPAPVR